MKKYDVAQMMRQLKKVTVDRAIKNGFEDESIYNDDVGLVMDDNDVEIFKKLSDVLSGQKKSAQNRRVIVNNNGMTKEEYEQAERAKSKHKHKRSPEEIAAIKKQQEAKKDREKVISLLRAVSIRLPMLIYGARDADFNENISLEHFAAKIDEESWQVFMPENLTKDLFKQLLRYYDTDVVIGAGMRIRSLARAADELPPVQRSKKIAEIFGYFRNPNKETVLTPWRVVNMHMGDTIGGYNCYAEGYGNDDILQEPRLIENGEVTADIFLKEDAKVLEMNSKSGLYPLYLANSFYCMELAKPEKDLPLEETQKIWRNVLEKHIFVVCMSPMARLITIRTLAGFHNDWQVNAIYLPHLLERMKDDQPRLARKLSNPVTWGKEGEKLKFDAIVGNPPYQLAGGSGGTNDAPIYQYFADLAEKIDPNYISLIIPARWFAGGRENLLLEFRNNMIHNNSIRQMTVFTDSHSVFPTVEIKGGICYYLFDKNYAGNCEYTIIQENKSRTFYRNLADFDILIREPLLANIVKKVMNEDIETVDEIISGDTPFGIPTNPKTSAKNPIQLYESCNDEHNTVLYFIENSKRKKAYIDRSIVKKNTSAIDKYKVFIPKASGSGSDPYVIGKPEYAQKNSVCSQTFLYAAFNTDIEAKNFITYIKTKFLEH